VRKERSPAVKIAVTVWGNRISPVFDSSGTLMIVTIEHTDIMARSIISFDPQYPVSYMRILRQYEVDVLICGAITKGHSAMLKAGGICLVSFVTGSVDSVLGLYVNAPDQIGAVLMPGALHQPYTNSNASKKTEKKNG
jgi:predicted Fe-Mo cluster-binding NifX family protein